MEKLMKILQEVKPGVVYEGKTDLIDSGVLDSFDVITLVAELNEAYEIDIPVEEIVEENFNSVEAIYSLIQKLLDE